MKNTIRLLVCIPLFAVLTLGTINIKNNFIPEIMAGGSRQVKGIENEITSGPTGQLLPEAASTEYVESVEVLGIEKKDDGSLPTLFAGIVLAVMGSQLIKQGIKGFVGKKI